MPDQKAENMYESKPYELYLSVKIAFHLPDIVGSLNLNHHLARRTIFIEFKLSTPNPLWNLGEQTIDYEIKLYFFLSEVFLVHKNLLRILSICFLILTGNL